MKLLRYGQPGREKPGLLAADGTIRDLSGSIADIDGASLTPAALDKLRGLDPATLPKVADGTRIGPCVGNVRHFIAIGLNYADHAAETGAPIPKEPIIFSKAPSSIGGPNDDIVIPKGSDKPDWEVELALMIGKRASYIREDEALAHVAGYFVCNDVSERTFQMDRGGQWMKGKGCPTFGPIGPWLVTADEVPDPQNLALWLDVNGERMQTGSTKTMIFSAAFVVAYCSQFMTLEPGDIITTGTPPGVGLGFKPPRFLKPGDVMTLGVEGLGEQRQAVKAWQG